MLVDVSVQGGEHIDAVCEEKIMQYVVVRKKR